MLTRHFELGGFSVDMGSFALYLSGTDSLFLEVLFAGGRRWL